jgi:hypothetical protein
MYHLANRVGTADEAWCINRNVGAAFAHPTRRRRK